MYFEGELFFFIFAATRRTCPDRFFKMVVVAQLVRASDCDSEGRGFEPPRLPKKIPAKRGSFFWDRWLNRIIFYIKMAFVCRSSLRISKNLV